MTFPAMQPARSHKFAQRTSANFTLSGTNWANLDTSLDLTADANPGDVLVATVNALWGNEAQTGLLNAWTLVSAAALNPFGATEPTASTGDGVPGWWGEASRFIGIGAPKRYTVQVADVVSGIVTVRLRYRITGAKTLYSETAHPFEWSLQNIGPQDPY